MQLIVESWISTEWVLWVHFPVFSLCRWESLFPSLTLDNTWLLWSSITFLRVAMLPLISLPYGREGHGGVPIGSSWRVEERSVVDHFLFTVSKTLTVIFDLPKGLWDGSFTVYFAVKKTEIISQTINRKSCDGCRAHSTPLEK